MAFITPICLTPSPPPNVSICTGPSCTDCRSRTTLSNFRHLLGPDQVQETACLGECGNGPNLVLCYNNTNSLHKHVESVHHIENILKQVLYQADDDLLHQLTLFEKANQQLSMGNPEQALTIYNTLLTTATDTFQIRLLCNRSAAYLELQHPKSALLDANTAVDLHPGSQSAWRRKAEAHDHLREWKSAAASWRTWGRLGGGKEEAEKKISRRWNISLPNLFRIRNK